MIKIKIKDLLEKRNLTMYWLAKETGISQVGMINICNQKTEGIKYENIDKICEALNVKVEDIIEFIPNDKKSCD